MKPICSIPLLIIFPKEGKKIYAASLEELFCITITKQRFYYILEGVCGVKDEQDDAGDEEERHEVGLELKEVGVQVAQHTDGPHAAKDGRQTEQMVLGEWGTENVLFKKRFHIRSQLNKERNKTF